MEMTAKETSDEAVDKDLGASSPTEIYSMTDKGAHHDPIPHDPSEKQLKKEDKKKTDHSLLFWRAGLAVLAILVVSGVIYFVGKGVNLAIHKISGKSAATANVTTSSILRSVADPLSGYPTAPVISNNNIVPVGGVANSGYGSSSSASPQVLGASTSVKPGGSNCPDYDSNHYYCEWMDQYRYRPYDSKAEYDGAHAVKTAPVTTGYTPPAYPTTPTVPTTGRSRLAANNCPDYDAANYAYCIWYGPSIYRGFEY